jgi:hypothetical protein
MAMFYMDKNSASSSLLENSPSANLHIWRFLTASRYSLDETGRASAKSEAFDIKRDADGVTKEPSASLFELRDFKDCCRENALRFLHGMNKSKGFEIKRSTASGALSLADVGEIRKDPKAFSLNISSGQGNSVMIHWDLAYSRDDQEKEMQDVKNALAIACKVFVKGECALIP